MLTNNTYTRVYWIKCGRKHGTAFLIDVDNRRYMITAKHVVEEYSDVNSLMYSKNNSWHKLQVELMWKSDHESDLDIAIFSPKEATRPNKPGFDVLVNPQGVKIGQDVYFVGFPFTLYTDPMGINDGFPLGLVKKACMSGVDSRKDIYYLDGIVNPGFSGAPVLTVDEKTGENRIFGIIEGFVARKNPIYIDGKEQETMEIEYNTGIIRAFNIQVVLNEIKNSPNGFQLYW